MERVILVVDDDKTNLILAQKILGMDYRVAAANSGSAAFRYLENNRPNLILLDINMPQMDGFEVIKQLKSNRNYRQIPVIFLTADNDAEIETRCFLAGAADFVRKPFVAAVLHTRVQHIMELNLYHTRMELTLREQAEIIEARTHRISEIQEKIISGMANLIESRDHNTGEHVKNTGIYVDMIARQLKRRHIYEDILTEEYLHDLRNAAPLHDIGKIKISDAILQKPGKLTAEEFDAMKKHTQYGKQIIRDIIGELEEMSYITMAEDIAYCHHERWDGTGYPRGLSGEQIPLCARIMALADVFDALYSERPYKSPMRPLNSIFDLIGRCGGTQFDPLITKVFLELRPQLTKMLQDGNEQEA